MIKDFSEFEDQAVIAADVCIVGAGAAGITIAKEFIASRFTVVMLESGGLLPEADTQKLYESEFVGLSHSFLPVARVRVFGGTTTLWGGQALRFDDFDFLKRNWVPFSGWPFGREQLEPYYQRSAAVLQVRTPVSYGDLCASFGVSSTQFDAAKLGMLCSQWSPRPNFGAEYRQEIKESRNVTTVLHANVTGITTNRAATLVESIQFRTLAGKHGTAKARFYIICAGAIETARLLLASDQIESSGVGNKNDLVGRFYQEHPMIWYGELRTANRERMQDMFESFYRHGLKYFPILSLSGNYQQERQILNIQGSITFEDTPDSAITAMKTLYGAAITRKHPGPRELRRLIVNALTDPAEFLRLTYRFGIQKRAGTPNRGPITFGGQCEMAPNPESRVTLSQHRDQLGMRRVVLDWRLGELERRTASEFIQVIASEFERLGLATYDLAQASSLSGPNWTHMAHDSAHHMGTTRMHESAEFGVVDANCQVHGIANLYIGSSSVFPTSSRSNPTMTILALCIRIADHVKQLL